MNRVSCKKWASAAVYAALLCLSTSMLAQFLIRNLYQLLPQDSVFPAIFAQLRAATIHTPVFFFLIPAYLCCLAGVQLWHKRAWRIPVVLGGVVLAVLFCALCAFFSTVNGVRFGDILLSLLNVLEKGGLDGL